MSNRKNKKADTAKKFFVQTASATLAGVLVEIIIKIINKF